MLQPLWETVCRFLKKTENRTCDPDRGNPVSIKTLFPTSKIRKQPKCPSTDEWAKKMWCVHNGLLLSCEKEQDLAICDHMDGLEHVVLSEISQTEKDQCLMISLAYGM